jgi:hypothetical protein
MSDSILIQSGTPSVEKEVNALLSDIDQSLRHSYQICERHVRQAPTTSVLGAVLAGYCLHRLPLRAIMVANVRVLSSLLPPVIFALGAAKTLELIQNSARSHKAKTS